MASSGVAGGSDSIRPRVRGLLRGAGWRTDALIFAFAAVPRLLYLFVAPRRFLYDYWDLAGSVLQSGTLGFDGVPTTCLEPLYPLVVAALRVLTGDRVILAQVLQIAIGSLAAVCLFRLTVALTPNRRTAWLAAGLFAVYPLSIRHAADGTDVTLMTTLVVAGCWAFVEATTAGRAALAGALIGLAILTRTMALPLIPLAGLLLLRERQPRAALAFTVAALLVFAPYAIRNYALNGAILPTRTGLNLLVSNSVYTQALVPEYQADLLEPYAESLLARDGLGSERGMSPALEREQDLALTRYAWEDMSRRPLELITLRLRYVGYFLAPFLVPSHIPGDNFDVRLEEGGRVTLTNFPLRPLSERVLYTMSYGPVLVLALFGLFQRRARHRREGIIWSVAIIFVAAHSIFFPATRYRVPMDFVFIIYAAIQLETLAGRYLPSRAHAEPQIV